MEMKTSEGDLISRQAAIDLLDEFEEGIENGDRSVYTRTREKMCELPSAQPEQKKGQWIDTGDTEEVYTDVFKCNLCGELMLGESDYCPGCGAKMEQSVENQTVDELVDAADKLLRFFDKRFTNSVTSSQRVVVEDWSRLRHELGRIRMINRREVKEWLT